MDGYAGLGMGADGPPPRSGSSRLMDWLTACLAALDLRNCLPIDKLMQGEEVEMNGKRFQVLKQVRQRLLVLPSLKLITF